jgi:hypothetical protein
MMFEGPRISGTIACRVRDLIEERLGRERFDQFLQLLPPTAREATRVATMVDWIPVEQFNTVYPALARLTRRQANEVAEDLAREVVERTLSTVWRALLRFTTDSALLARAPVLYSKTFDTGSAKVLFEAQRRVRVVVTGWPGMPELSVLTLGTGIATVLKFAGRPNARLTHRLTKEGVEYSGSW